MVGSKTLRIANRRSDPFSFAQVSYPVGRLIPLRNPFTLGIRLGLSLLAGIGGADAVVRFAAPDRAWTYAYGGISSGIGQNLSGAGANGYVGFVWNVNQTDDYSGPFYCTTLTPHSLSPGLGISSSFPISVCSSKGKGDGRPGAYSVTMPLIATQGGARSTGAVQASRASYGYLARRYSFRRGCTAYDPGCARPLGTGKSVSKARLTLGAAVSLITIGGHSAKLVETAKKILASLSAILVAVGLIVTPFRHSNI